MRPLFAILPLAILLSAALLLPGFAPAQTVYKCIDKNGSPVFATEPCGKDAVAKTYVNEAPHPAPGTPMGAEDKPSGNSGSAQQDIANSVADSTCRRNAQNQYREPSTAALDQARQELSTLQTPISNPNGAAPTQYLGTYSSQQRVNTLQQTIAAEEARVYKERTDTQHAMQVALALCDRQKMEREKSAK